MDNTELLKLYEDAKEAYYNGEPIMGDAEFDELESKLGLSNKSYIGTHHNPSYTVKHPVIMGSLSKVQVKEDDNGHIDWEIIVNDVKSYVLKNNAEHFIVTPKFDGCSFEAVIDNIEGKQKIISISTRGDGEYGKSMMDRLKNLVKRNLIDVPSLYMLRGEILIKKSVFDKKYSVKYTNTRSFVAGVSGKELDKSDKEAVAENKDLSIVVYDVKINDDEKFVDKDWTNYCKYLTDAPEFAMTVTAAELFDDFESIYNTFNNYRENTSEYSLDGFVIKPVEQYREQNFIARPKDCVAIKFIPKLDETEVTEITWNLGKTGEYIPIINIKPIILDGKVISKCSGHNYGYLVENKISASTKVILSLAGDIIPFLYKVTDNSKYNESNLFESISDKQYEINGCHLMGILSDKEKAEQAFISSAISLNIPNIGKATAEKIFEYCTKDNGETDIFFNEETYYPNNILLVSAMDVYFGTGTGKSGNNAKTSFEKYVKSISLKEIIKSCNFKLCGNNAAEQIENKLLNKEYSFANLPEVSYSWIENKESEEYKQFESILNFLSKSIEDFKEFENSKNSDENSENKIPVILTGEPNDYSSKAQFIEYNPQYRITTSWKEVQIVFTNSLESNTGKMKKAREKGIEIKLY